MTLLQWSSSHISTQTLDYLSHSSSFTGSIFFSPRKIQLGIFLTLIHSLCTYILLSLLEYNIYIKWSFIQKTQTLAIVIFNYSYRSSALKEKKLIQPGENQTEALCNNKLFDAIFSWYFEEAIIGRLAPREVSKETGLCHYLSSMAGNYINRVQFPIIQPNVHGDYKYFLEFPSLSGNRRVLLFTGFYGKNWCHLLGLKFP